MGLGQKNSRSDLRNKNYAVKLEWQRKLKRIKWRKKNEEKETENIDRRKNRIVKLKYVIIK